MRHLHIISLKKGTANSKTCITIKTKRYGLILIRLQSFFTTFAATLISIFILELQFSLSHFSIFVWSFPRPICLDLLTENGRVNCRVIVDSHMPWACKAFSQLHGQLLARNPSLLQWVTATWVSACLRTAAGMHFHNFDFLLVIFLPEQTGAGGFLWSNSGITIC